MSLPTLSLISLDVFPLVFTGVPRASRIFVSGDPVDISGGVLLLVHELLRVDRCPRKL